MRTIYLLIIFIFCGATARAQVGYGIEAGIGMATMKFAPAQLYSAGDASPIAGGKLGGLVDVPLSRHLAFQSGAYISRKGAIRSFSYYLNDSFNESVHQTLHISYVDLPLALFYKTGIQGKGRFTAGIGAMLSYITGGKNKLHDHLVFNDTLYDSNIVLKISNKNPVSAFDMGLYVSAGYELPVGLFFRAYYVSGTRDIGLGTEIDKNKVLGISAGWIFGKGRNINKEADDLIDKGK
jgi:hypothetical protein